MSRRLVPSHTSLTDSSSGPVSDLTRATDFFDPSNVDERIKELKKWIQDKGVRDFDKVPLYSEQLDKVCLLCWTLVSSSIIDTLLPLRTPSRSSNSCPTSSRIRRSWKTSSKR